MRGDSAGQGGPWIGDDMDGKENAGTEDASSSNGMIPSRGMKGHMRRNAAVIVISVLTVCVLVVASLTVLFAWNSASSFGASSATISYSSFIDSDAPPGGVTVVNSTNSIYVNGSGITIYMVSTPVWLNRSGDFFTCYGLVNPTFHIRNGISVNFELINADTEYHSLVITSEAPPYQYMPMAGSGMGMMWGGSQWARSTPMLSGVYGNFTGSTRMPMAALDIGFQNSGTYWYLCGYPGHAQSGMYGRIVVA